MNTGALVKITAKTAAEVCKKAPLEAASQALLRPDTTPAKFLEQLVEKGFFPDAVRFLSQALPKREAVWWACLCIRAEVGPNFAPPALGALAAAEKWVADPSEANRLAAKTAAEQAGLGTPAGCAAMAAFWSGGSLAPPNLPAVPPGDALTGQGVAGAVLLAVLHKEPEKAVQKFKKALTLGVDIANGGNRWKEAGK